MIKQSKLRGRLGMRSVAIAVFLLFGMWANPAISQKNELVDNVIQMHKFKMNPAMIKGAIQSAKNAKLSLSDKKKLKAAGVPDDIIAEMEKAANAGVVPAAEPAPEPAPEAGAADDLESMRDDEAKDAEERAAEARVREQVKGREGTGELRERRYRSKACSRSS